MFTGPPSSSLAPNGAAPRSADLPRFQYGLKGLFLLTTAFAGLTALASMISTVALVAVVWFLLLVLAHVAGNAWGRRQQREARAPSELDEGPPPPTEVAAAWQRPRDVSLGRRVDFGRSMFFTVTVAAAAGLAAGALFVLCGGMPRWNAYGLVVASFSAAVLGGVLGFLLSGCLRVLAQALAEATDSTPAVRSRD